MNTDQVTALVRALIDKDNRLTEAYLAQLIAAATPKSGVRTPALAKLQSLRDYWRSKATPTTVYTAPKEIQPYLLTAPRTTTFADLVLSPDNAAAFEVLTREYLCRYDLQARGLAHSSRVLLRGPSGVGKTASASALANSVGLPLVTISIARLVGSHLGETSGRISGLFAYMRESPAVYLFDEADSVAATRHDGSGDGSGAERENARIVNTMLVGLDEPFRDAIVVLATNFAPGLDRALSRRLDAEICMDTNQEIVSELTKQRLEMWCNSSETVERLRREILEQLRCGDKNGNVVGWAPTPALVEREVLRRARAAICAGKETLD